MKFKLKFEEINEERELEENYKIKDLLEDLNLSSQSTVLKQNGNITIEDSVINDGDEINIIKIIFGG